MDLKIKDVAELLALSEETIARLVSEGQLPAYRMEDELRFSPEEIENWVLSQKLSFKEEEAPKANHLQFSLYRALYRGDAISLPATSKQELIQGAMAYMAQRYDLDADVLTDLFLDREQMMSTALGEGIAVPHTRDFLLETHFDVVLTVYPEKPLDWEALDGKPVHTLFFLFACEDKHHLHLLSKIAHLSAKRETRAFFQTRPSKEHLLAHVKTWEGALK